MDLVVKVISQAAANMVRAVGKGLLKKLKLLTLLKCTHFNMVSPLAREDVSQSFYFGFHTFFLYNEAMLRCSYCNSCLPVLVHMLSVRERLQFHENTGISTHTFNLNHDSPSFRDFVFILHPFLLLHDCDYTGAI